MARRAERYCRVLATKAAKRSVGCSRPRRRAKCSAALRTLAWTDVFERVWASVPVRAGWGTNIWKSNARLHLWWPDQKTPSYDWEKRVDEIFEAGIHEMDKDKRKDLYREWVAILYEQQPFIYTTAQERVVAIRRKFGNLFPSPSPNRNAVFHNEEEIFDLGATQTVPPAARAWPVADSGSAANAGETAR